MLVLIIFAIQANGQSSYLNSLYDSLSKTKNDSIKVELFNEISWELQIKNPEKAKHFASQAIRLAKQINFKKGIATGYNRFGIVDKNLGYNQSARAYYDSALSLEESINNQYGIARASNELAVLNHRLGNSHTGIDLGKKSLTIFETLNRLPQASIVYTNLGFIFTELSDFDSAQYYLNKGLNIRLSRNDKPGIAESYLNIGLLLERSRNYRRSLLISSKSYELFDSLQNDNMAAMALTNIGNAYYKLGKSDSAEINYLKGLSIRERLNQLPLMATSYSNLGNVYEAKGDFEKAESFHKKGLLIRQSNSDPKQLISAINLGNLAIKKDQKSIALEYYIEAQKLVDSLKLRNSYPEIFSMLASVYSSLGNSEKALYYSNEYSSIKEAIEKKLIRANNLELEIQEERNKASLLQKEREKERIENSRKNIIIYSLLGGLILFTLLFFALLKNQVIKKNNAIQTAQIEKLIKDQEVKTVNAIMEGQEKERVRIARDLHDRLGGMLSVVKMNFKSVEESLELLKEKNIKQYKDANNLLDEACEEVRKIAHDMASGVLMKLGLVPALQSLKNTVETTKRLKINLLDIGLEGRLSYDYEINIYRIIQELVTNTLKHAKATELSIQIFKKPTSLNIIVEDDGIGFNPNRIRPDGIGLINVRSRVDKLNGEMNIDSGKGGGTTITIDIPIMKPVKND